MLDVIFVGAETPFFYIIRRYLGPRMPVVAVGAEGFFVLAGILVHSRSSTVA